MGGPLSVRNFQRKVASDSGAYCFPSGEKGLFEKKKTSMQGEGQDRAAVSLQTAGETLRKEGVPCRQALRDARETIMCGRTLRRNRKKKGLFLKGRKKPERVPSWGEGTTDFSSHGMQVFRRN